MRVEGADFLHVRFSPGLKIRIRLPSKAIYRLSHSSADATTLNLVFESPFLGAEALSFR